MSILLQNDFILLASESEHSESEPVDGQSELEDSAEDEADAVDEGDEGDEGNEADFVDEGDEGDASDGGDSAAADDESGDGLLHPDEPEAMADHDNAEQSPEEAGDDHEEFQEADENHRPFEFGRLTGKQMEQQSPQPLRVQANKKFRTEPSGPPKLLSSCCSSVQLRPGVLKVSLHQNQVGWGFVVQQTTFCPVTPV